LIHEIVAAIILVDEELNSASVRIYNEGEAEGVSARVVSASEHNPFVDELKQRLDLQANCWTTIHRSALMAISDHRKNLQFKINES
jgi:hypothetical protein